MEVTINKKKEIMEITCASDLGSSYWTHFVIDFSKSYVVTNGDNYLKREIMEITYANNLGSNLTCLLDKELWII